MLGPGCSGYGDVLSLAEPTFLGLLLRHSSVPTSSPQPLGSARVSLLAVWYRPRRLR